LLPSLATFAVFPVLLALGFWQLDRADQKREVSSRQLERGALAPLVLNDRAVLGDDTAGILWRRGIARGKYAVDRIFLLDNQVHNSRPGYHVYTPFLISGVEKWVMVNRGWVPAEKYRDQVPVVDTPAENVTVNGRILPVQQPGLVLDDGVEELMTKRISRLQSLRLGRLETALGHELLPFVLRLEPSSPGGFIREWPVPGPGAERHLGYAFQWFSLSAALLIIYVVVNTSRGKGG